MSLVPCLVVSILETISLSLSAAIQPIRSDQQSSTERSRQRKREGTRLEVTQSRPHVHCHGSPGSIHSWAGLSGGHGYSRNSTRSGSIAHIDSISPPTATHTSSHLVFPFVVAAAFFSSGLLLFFCSRLVTSHNPPSPRQHASGCAALYMQQAYRQTVGQNRQSLARGESRPLSARPPALSPLHLLTWGHRLQNQPMRVCLLGAGPATD